MTDKNEIRSWFDDGVSRGHTFMIVVCDTFDWEDHPVYTSLGGFNEEYWKNYNHPMQQIMEVYDLSMDRETQMAEHRAFHYPPGFNLNNKPTRT